MMQSLQYYYDSFIRLQLFLLSMYNCKSYYVQRTCLNFVTRYDFETHKTGDYPKQEILYRYTINPRSQRSYRRTIIQEPSTSPYKRTSKRKGKKLQRLNNNKHNRKSMKWFHFQTREIIEYSVSKVITHSFLHIQTFVSTEKLFLFTFVN